MLNFPVNNTEADLPDNLANAPGPSFFSKWIFGVIVPICLLIYGIRCCALQKAVLFGRNGSELHLSGMPAVVMGFAWISAAFFLHFHCFWTAVKRLCLYADFAKTTALLCFAGTFGYVIWTIIR